MGGPFANEFFSMSTAQLTWFFSGRINNSSDSFWAETGLRYLRVILLAALILLPALPGASQERFVEVRVARGDTLRAICATYLRDPAAWPEIVRLNRMANPSQIVPGQVILIPVRLAKAAPSEGTAEFLHGKAEIRLPESAEWKPLGSGDRIPQGSTVRTLPESSLEIGFENGDTCFLRPETTVGITETVRDGNTWIRRLFLQAGKIIARVQKATGTQTRFEVQTPSAQCAARGTVFRATADTDDMSRSEVLEGAVAIEARGSRVDVAESFGTAVKKGEAPLPPRPLLPGPVPARVERAYNKLPLSIDFLPVPKAVSYLAALTKDREGRETAAEAVLTPGQAFRVAGVPDGVYYLHCRAIDDLGLEGLPSAPVEILVRTEPRPPRLQGIASGARLRGGGASVKWAPVAGAQAYRLQISGDPGFASLLDQPEIRTTAWTPAGLAVGDYHLRARSVAADGYEGDWSETTSFSVLPPYAPPVLDKPDRESGWIRLRWSGLGPAVVYRVHVAKDADFRTLIRDELVSGSETLLPAPAESGVYYARVKAFDGNGCESGFSNAEKFRVGGFFTNVCKPCLLAPLAVLIYLLTR
jgi:hypothetical protein